MANDWADKAAPYQQSFARLCAGAIPYLKSAVARGVAGPARVLDVGTGTGNVALALREGGHSVVGVDIEPAMIDYARNAVPGAEFEVAGVPELPFAAGGFDAVVANFVINHVPKPRAAMAELVRMSRPGGLVAATIWPSEPTSALNAFWGNVIERAAVAPQAGTRLAPEDDFERSVAGLGALFTEQSLENVEAHELAWDFEIDADDLWLGVEAGIATIGAIYTAQSAEGRAAMRHAYAACVASAGTGTLVFPSVAVIATGTAESSA